jgi:exosortase family protein XrtM
VAATSSLEKAEQTQEARDVRPGPLFSVEIEARRTMTPLRFAVRFLLGCGVLLAAFEASRGTAFERFVIEGLILRPAAFLINLLSPADHVQLIGRTLALSGGAALRVTRGCEGIEMFLLLIAALLAFPALWRQRAQGLLVGSVLAYLLSLIRLILLCLTLRYSPTLWEALHGLVLPLGPIVFLAIYFARWSASASADGAKPAPHAA